MRWFTSDLHLGHHNIIEYSGRPFHHTSEMNAVLVARWNEVVAPDDDVWVLGDVAMGSIEDSLAICALLAGRKTLVVGNHDRPFRDGQMRPHWRGRYRSEGGFTDIHHGAVETTVGPHSVLVCHFPYEGDSVDHDRYLDERPADDGRWLIHGHVHETWRQRGRMINVGVDAWGGRPVQEAELVALINAGEGDLPPLNW